MGLYGLLRDSFTFYHSRTRLTILTNVVTSVLEEQKLLLKVEAACPSETLAIIYQISFQKTGKFIATVMRTSDLI
jgi:hypothetical protein